MRTNMLAWNLFPKLTARIKLILGLEKRLAWLRDCDIKTIIDVGANIGQFALIIHRLLPEAAIYCFEPLTDCYERLVANLHSVRDVTAFNFGLGDHDGQALIQHNEFSPSSSLLPVTDVHKAAFPFATKIHEEKVTLKCLDDVAEDLSLEKGILIKLDVQGYEHKVIMGGTETISKADVLLVETSFQPLYDGQPSFRMIYGTLKEMGFEYHGNAGQVRSPIDNSVLQADAIFLRNKSRNVPCRRGS